MKLLWPTSPDPPVLQADCVDVWAVPLDDRPAALRDHLAMLSQDEQQRAELFRNEGPQRRFVTARAALRIILAPYLSISPADVEFDIESGGKPQLRPHSGPAHVRFNLAHGGELALIAVSLGCDVGIDVEPLRAVSRFEQIAARYFHPAEAAELLTAPVGQRATAFLRCWTGKEAVLKAVGVGLGFGLERVRVPLSEHNGAWISTGDSRSTTPLGIKSLIRSPKSEIASCWLVPLSPAEDYIGALACVGEQRRLSLRSLRM